MGNDGYDVELRKAFSQRLKELRTNMKLTQEQFGKLVGASRGTISYYESMERVPDIVSIMNIAKATNCSFDYILGLSENRTTDMSIKSICEMTGLSESIVKKMCDEQKDGSAVYSDFLNRLTGSFIFCERTEGNFPTLYLSAKQDIDKIMELREIYNGERKRIDLKEWVKKNIEYPTFDVEQLDESTLTRSIKSYQVVCEFLHDRIYAKRYRMLQMINEILCSTKFTEGFSDEMEDALVDILVEGTDKTKRE